MEHTHSIIIIKKENKFLNYYDKNWKMYLFPNLKGNDIEEINEGKLGRLMLSSIFAMVSNSQLNELSPTSVEDTDG